MNIVQELIDLFETAPRSGASKDEPEGVRYIQISDTLARDLLQRLKNLRTDPHDARLSNGPGSDD